MNRFALPPIAFLCSTAISLPIVPPSFAADSVALSTAANDQSSPTIVSDGMGGAIATWRDYRNGSALANADIYAQRVNAAGVPQWTADGVALCTAANDQGPPTIVSDGAGEGHRADHSLAGDHGLEVVGSGRHRGAVRAWRGWCRGYRLAASYLGYSLPISMGSC